MTPQEMLDMTESEERILEKVFLKRVRHRKSSEVVLAAWILNGMKAMGVLGPSHRQLVQAMVNSITGKRTPLIVKPGVKS